MLASVDVGSNTLRLLIGEVHAGRVFPREYHRRITRLGGGFTPETGLSRGARERTLSALEDFARQLDQLKTAAVSAVGTAAFRKACNGEEFAALVRSRTGIPLRIIDGEEEAMLTARGVRSALDPIPPLCLIFDLGGGSTEFILCRGEDVILHCSYGVGVVSLCEESPSPEARLRRIDDTVNLLLEELAGILPLPSASLRLVGTAGTVTTLAALHLEMRDYDWRKINNLVLTGDDLTTIGGRLAPLSVDEREKLPGMEPGRGDLILPGLELIQALMAGLQVDLLTVSDFGLLEGLLLSATEEPANQD